MQGFGVQTKNINDLIRKIEQEIAYITKNMDKNVVQLNNKLVTCTNDLNTLKTEFANLKNYTETEYNQLKATIQSYERQIADLRNNLNHIDYETKVGEKCAVGISPKKEYEQTGASYPIYAKYADKDSDGNVITDTYANLNDTLTTSASMLKEENKTKLAQAQAITGAINGMMSVRGHQLILGLQGE